VDLGNRYICNARGEPIASFGPKDLAKCYHLEKGTKNLEKKLLGEFKHTTKDLCPIWYKPDKQFKLRPTDWISHDRAKKALSIHGGHVMQVVWEQYASKFPLSYIPLIYYCTEQRIIVQLG
jgi:hypothetical protein